jgi:hypothetical protein
MPEPRTRSPRKSAAKAPTSESAQTRAGGKAETTEGALSHDEIARRAHEIAHGPDAGSDDENWLRAEQELRGARASGSAP